MEAKICQICKKLYIPTGRYQKYCKDCKPRYVSRLRSCIWCGKEFYDNSKTNQQKYCSAECRHLAKNLQASESISKKRCRQRLGMSW